MTYAKSERSTGRRAIQAGIGAAVLTLGSLSGPARADENGYSFWLPGQFGSLAAAPGVPGWAMAEVYYHTSVSASGAVAAARQIQVGRFPANVNVSLNASLTGHADAILLNPSYTFATPVLGGQLTLGMTGAFGRVTADINGTLTTVVGPVVGTRTGSITDDLTSVGDLFPMASLKWNAGVHNFMTYVTGNIPVGFHDSGRLANLTIGHGAVDGGGGYTYFNPQSGQEFSVVSGLTYNLKNHDTQYRNGIDFHFDWGMSQFLTKQTFVGLVGYGYQQLTDDSGAHPILGGFRSRIFGIGPQFGYLFPVGDMQGYVNVKAYGEFAA